MEDRSFLLRRSRQWNKESCTFVKHRFSHLCVTWRRASGSPLWAHCAYCLQNSSHIHEIISYLSTQYITRLLALLTASCQCFAEYLLSNKHSKNLLKWMDLFPVPRWWLSLFCIAFHFFPLLLKSRLILDSAQNYPFPWQL